MDDLPPEINAWMESCKAQHDELPDDDDWQALKGALLDTLPTEPVDLFAELGLRSEVALFVEPGDEPNSQSTFSDGPSGASSSHSLDHVFASSVSHDTNGSKASTSYRQSNSSDTEDESDEEKQEKLVKMRGEQGKMRLMFRGKEYALDTQRENEDEDAKSWEDASMLPKEEMDPLQSIFRVWDLETPDEEDELTKKLKKAMGEDRNEEGDALPDLDSDSPSTEIVDKLGIGEIVAWFADLSLQPHPSV